MPAPNPDFKVPHAPSWKFPPTEKLPDGHVEDLVPEVREQWDAFWRSDVAGLVRECDVPVIRRLFTMRHQYEKLIPIISARPMTQGSQGQLKSNPLFDTALKLDSAMLRIENELGLTPMSRQRLGLLVGQNMLTLDQMNDILDANFADDTDDDDDPRLIATGS